MKNVSMNRQVCYFSTLHGLKRPTWRLGVGCVEAGEIDKGIRCQEEI